MHFDAKDAFAAFYAIFWGVVLASMRTLGPFRIDGFSNGRDAATKNIKRFLWGLLILNVCPAAWFVVLIKCDWFVPEGKTAPAILTAAFAALSVFAFLNFGYARFGTESAVEKLYTQDEFKKLNERKKLKFEEPPSRHFFILAIIYIVFFPTLAMLTPWLCSSVAYLANAILEALSHQCR